MKKNKKATTNTISSSLIETISDLCKSGKPLLHSRLAELSNLNSAELRCWEQTWKTIMPERQRDIISQLIELAEDNVELDFESIFQSHLKDPDAEVRSKAIDGLWESEDSSLVNTLVDLLDHDKSEQVQKAAAVGLGKFAILAEHNKLRSSHADKISQALLNAMKNKKKPQEVRLQALAAAAPLSYPWVKDAIGKAYQSDDQKFKNIAIYSMGKNCDNSWLPILLKELSSNDAATRYEAATACGEMGEEEAVPKLIELTNYHDIEVSLAAIQALGKIGGFRARNHLQHCLENPSKVIQQAAKQALEELLALADPLSFNFQALL